MHTQTHLQMCLLQIYAYVSCKKMSEMLYDYASTRMLSGSAWGLIVSYPLLHSPALRVPITLARVAAMSRLHEAEGKPPVAQLWRIGYHEWIHVLPANLCHSSLTRSLSQTHTYTSMLSLSDRDRSHYDRTAGAKELWAQPSGFWVNFCKLGVQLYTC